MTMEHRPKLVVTALLIATMTLVGPTTAFAADTPSPVDLVASSAARVAPSAPKGPQIQELPDGRFSADSSTTSVVLPSSSEGAISITASSQNGEESQFAIGLPNAGLQARGALATTGSVIYTAPSTAHADLVVESIGSGIRIQTVIQSATAPTEYRYRLSPGVTPALLDNGTVELRIAHPGIDQILGVIAPAWAFDKNHNAVPTHYEVRGSSLVQIVEHRNGNVAYPVVADPSIAQINAFQYRIRWNRAETATIASGGWGAAIGATGCGLLGSAIGTPVLGAIAFAACGAAGTVIVYNAGVAQNSSPKRCVQMTFTNVFVAPPFPWVDTYACR